MAEKGFCTNCGRMRILSEDETTCKACYKRSASLEKQGMFRPYDYY